VKIAIIESFNGGSHKSWIEGLMKNSTHDIISISLEGKYWKWRMRGGAISLAEKFLRSNFRPDLFLLSDMVDATIFKSLIGHEFFDTPLAMYFHENQLSYPWNYNEKFNENKKMHYGFINYSSALISDHVFFNSIFHMNSFFKDANQFLKQFPDHNELQSIEKIKAKSSTLPLGIDLKRFDKHKINEKGKLPLILWNHRWDYDKDPSTFFDVMQKLKNEKEKFELVILGQNIKAMPKIFRVANEKLKENIRYIGYCKTLSEYSKWLYLSDILPVTNIQDFFGISIVEAVYCGTYPLLPKRLTYPDLFNYKKNSKLFYNNKNDLFYKIKHCVNNVDQIRLSSYSSLVKRYDWSEMIAEYDAQFLSVAKKLKTK
tara:strand:+ start:67 stop:1182 length:1116 start_codon:yes stop_codon:yes gene_type:complete